MQRLSRSCPPRPPPSPNRGQQRGDPCRRPPPRRPSPTLDACPMRGDHRAQQRPPHPPRPPLGGGAD
eukprot:422385-Prorocentrum_minimum.AAC.1